MLYIGVDLGTSAVKLLLMDETGDIKNIVSKEYPLFFPHPGWSEQNPEDWFEKSMEGIKELTEGFDRSKVAGISFGGQMHGLVALDKDDQVIRPAILWNDGRTGEETDYLNNVIGKDKLSQYTANIAFAGFTAPKILWMKKHEPENFARLATVLLPHDYINFYLTGRRVMEYGDASGTALLNVRTRQWSRRALQAIDGELPDKMPELIESDQPVGYLSAQTAELLGLNTSVLVSAGGGDNMMGAIGTGNTREGLITASFGTSGTIYACAGKPVIDPEGEIAAFCDSTNRWLPLLCTMNVTVATGMISDFFKLEIKDFDRLAAEAPAGSEGVLLVPYLEGERTPNVPDGTGVFFGINTRTMKPANLARAAMEGVTLGMNYGLLRLAELGVRPSQIRATGGGAHSPLWRQIMADIFNAEVVTLKVSEGAAYGAALQALWCWENHSGHSVKIQELSDRFVTLNTEERVSPRSENLSLYRDLQNLQNNLSISLRPAFALHSKMVRN